MPNSRFLLIICFMYRNVLCVNPNLPIYSFPPFLLSSNKFIVFYICDSVLQISSLGPFLKITHHMVSLTHGCRYFWYMLNTADRRERRQTLVSGRRPAPHTSGTRGESPGFWKAHYLHLYDGDHVNHHEMLRMWRPLPSGCSTDYHCPQFQKSTV